MPSRILAPLTCEQCGVQGVVQLEGYILTLQLQVEGCDKAQLSFDVAKNDPEVVWQTVTEFFEVNGCNSTFEQFKDFGQIVSQLIDQGIV